MTLALAVTIAALVGYGGWRLWRLDRSVAAISATVSSVPNRVDGELNRMWQDVQVTQAEHANACEARTRRAEAAASQIAKEHALLARHVAWMEPWVRYWATTSDDPGTDL